MQPARSFAMARSAGRSFASKAFRNLSRKIGDALRLFASGIRNTCNSFVHRRERWKCRSGAARLLRPLNSRIRPCLGVSPRDSREITSPRFLHHNTVRIAAPDHRLSGEWFLLCIQQCLLRPDRRGRHRRCAPPDRKTIQMKHRWRKSLVSGSLPGGCLFEIGPEHGRHRRPTLRLEQERES